MDSSKEYGFKWIQLKLNHKQTMLDPLNALPLVLKLFIWELVDEYVYSVHQPHLIP